MARSLAPCGSFSAYKRHKRNGEEVDSGCAQAARDQANARNASKREESANEVRARLVKVREEAHLPEIDELAEAYDTLNWIKAQMDSGVAQGAAALAKQRMELVALIKRLEGAAGPKESALDEIARKRAERIAASSH